ncbi:MAG: hypothetical protein K2O24_05720 [Muribaculaceae bacterium]|nr:hypothetical protein [Muribaculaceae bacterium]
MLRHGADYPPGGDSEVVSRFFDIHPYEITSHMKGNLTDLIKNIFSQGRRWIELEAEYVKLTAAEKFTVLTGTAVLGAICLMVGMVIIILLALSLADLFKMIMTPALAYLSVSGVLVLLIVILYLLRRQVIFDPIARFITRLFLDK